MMALFQRSTPLDVANASHVKFKTLLSDDQATHELAIHNSKRLSDDGVDSATLKEAKRHESECAEVVKERLATLAGNAVLIKELEAERAKAADHAIRCATVNEIEKTLTEIEAAKADYLASGSRLHSLTEFAQLYVPESGGVLALLHMAQTQLPDAYHMIDRCLRDQAAAILRHEAPAALRQIVAPVKPTVVPKPPTQMLFTLHALTWRDHDNNQRVIAKWRDIELPVAAAAFALKANLAMLPDDERTKKLRGLGQGHPEKAWLNCLDTHIGPDVPTAMAGNGSTSPQSVHDPIVASSPFTVVVGKPIHMQVARS